MPPLFRSSPLLLCLALSACAQQRPPDVAPPASVTPPGQCNDAAAQFAVGQVAAAKLLEEVRIRASAQRVRVVRPGQMVTMEYDASRLTLDVDAGNRIVRARCG